MRQGYFLNIIKFVQFNHGEVFGRNGTLIEIGTYDVR